MLTDVSRLATGAILLVLIESSPALAQYQITSLEELRRELAAGDLISIVETNGNSVQGRLLRAGRAGLNIQPDGRGPKMTIPLSNLESVERRGDSVRNGVLIGAALGAAPVLALFIYALAVDRNEVDEWAAMYVGFGAATTGIGALSGFAIDRAHWKPRAKFIIAF